jgi:DnaJ-class molecular chaperone
MFKMKKVLLILTVVIGFAFAANAQCSDCTCTCGATLQWNAHAYQTEKNCWSCGGDGLVSGKTKVPCTECGTTGKQKCNSDDGHNKYDRWIHCRDCSRCRGNGEMDVLKDNQATCSICRGTGIEYVWQSGCKCHRCGKAYTGCN